MCNNLKRIFSNKKITTEQFIDIFDKRFKERCIIISHETNLINMYIAFEEAIAKWNFNNTLEFTESDKIGEAPYGFTINLKNVNHIEIIDYWTDQEQIDKGARFIFYSKNNTQIIVDADK
jgi:hypothetical protein